jgi:hypothetical protein
MLFLMRKEDARQHAFIVVKCLYCAWLDLLRRRFWDREKVTRHKKGETQLEASFVVFCLFRGAANRRGDIFYHTITMYSYLWDF